MNALSRLLLLLAAVSLAVVAPTAVDAAVSCHRIDASGVGQDQGGGNTVAQISDGGLLQGTTAAAFTITGLSGTLASFVGTITFTANRASLAAEVAGAGYARDLTGADLRNAVLALAAADVAVSNDSGLLHVAAALGTPAIGIFGPTSPWHWAPLNPLAAAVRAEIDLPCRPCHKPTCRLGHHLCMRGLPVERLFALTVDALAAAKPRPA